MISLSVSETGHGMQTSWLKRCSLDDARSSVTDIKFAPKSMGLMLATCSTDGLVRTSYRERTQLGEIYHLNTSSGYFD